jgi:glycosyltransferase involved in cell wall biosynthesis
LATPESISIVIASHNGGATLQRCLASLAGQRGDFGECIVVDDGSTDDSIKHAVTFGARVIRINARRGPANARNLGALQATGSIVLFLDADVSVLPGMIAKIRARFESEPSLGALFGSYDADPSAPGLPSQFRNLLHCFIHQTSNHNASSFWAGCGAIRREVFLKSQGFDVSYSIPSVEDIELGSRLVRDGVRIALEPSIQVKHLKRWTLGKMVLNDIRQRGIPWTRLILASHHIPNDLNLRLSSRFSVFMVALACLVMALAAKRALLGPAHDSAWPLLLLPVLVGAVVAANYRFYRFLASSRNAAFAVASVPLHLVYFLCCGTSVVLGVTIYCWAEMNGKARRASTALAGQPED